jgi:hypothetical protein
LTIGDVRRDLLSKTIEIERKMIMGLLTVQVQRPLFWKSVQVGLTTIFCEVAIQLSTFINPAFKVF